MAGSLALATEEMRALLGVFGDARYPASTNLFQKLRNGALQKEVSGTVVWNPGRFDSLTRTAEHRD